MLALAGLQTVAQYRYETPTYHFFRCRRLGGCCDQAVNAALADADVKERFERLGAEPTGGTPQAFAAMVRADNAKWKKIISERKITAE